MEEQSPYPVIHFLSLIICLITPGCDSGSNPISPSIPISINWEPIKSPFGGSVRSVMTTGNNTTVVAELSDGIYWNDPTQETWSRSASGPSSPFTRLVKDGFGRLYISEREIMFISSDGGKNWIQKSLMSTSFLLATDGANNVYALTESRGIQHTDNGGDTWNTILLETETQQSLTDFSIISFESDQEGNLYVGTVNNGLFKKESGSLLWKSTSLILDGITILTSKEDDLYAYTISDGLFHSQDLGESWELVPSIWPSNASLVDLEVSNDGIVYAAVGLYGLFYSENNGLTWDQFDGRLPSDMTSLRIEGDKVYVSSFGGVWLVDIKRNSVTHKGVTNAELEKIFLGVDKIYTSTSTVPGNGSLFEGDIENGTWDRLSLGEFVTSLIFTNDNRLIAGTASGFEGESGEVLISHDMGDSWMVAEGPSTAILSLARLSTGELIAGTSGQIYTQPQRDGGVYVSTDNGTTWTFREIGVDVNSITETQDLQIFVAGSSSEDFNKGYIFKSQNKGDSWQQISIDDSNPVILSLTVDIEGNIYAGTSSNGIYRSANLGRSWQKTANNLNNVPVNSLTSDKNGFVYAGTDIGIYVSSNGVDWNPASNELGGIIVSSIIISDENILYAATRQKGIFAGSISF